MKKSRIRLVAAATLATVALTIDAQEVPRGTVGCGGDRLQGGQHVVRGTVGQSVVGASVAAGTVHQAGYWYLPGTTHTGILVSRFVAERAGSRVVLRWIVDDRIGDSRFHVWRSDPGQARERINPQPISGPGPFEFRDPNPPPDDLDYWLQVVGEKEAWIGPVRLTARPLVFGLKGNFPNPFNPRTNLRYELPTAEPVRLSIFDLRGRLVRVLMAAEQSPGVHTVVWDGRDDSGKDVATGTYFARLESPHGVRTTKMLLAR